MQLDHSSAIPSSIALAPRLVWDRDSGSAYMNASTEGFQGFANQGLILSIGRPGWKRCQCSRASCPSDALKPESSILPFAKPSDWKHQVCEEHADWPLRYLMLMIMKRNLKTSTWENHPWSPGFQVLLIMELRYVWAIPLHLRHWNSVCSANCSLGVSSTRISGSILSVVEWTPQTK